MQATGNFDVSPLLHAAALDLGRPVAGDVRWWRCEPADLAVLTTSDRDLISVVTGERFSDDHGDDYTDGADHASVADPHADPHASFHGLDDDVAQGRLVSFFVLQLALDRATGALAADRDVSIEYAEAVFEAYAECSAGSALVAEQFDLALAFLVGRDLARPDSPRGLRRGGPTP